MAASRQEGTLGEVLASRRRGRFVGRDAELELVRSALDPTDPPFAVLWFSGPGGIGKSTLLDVVADEIEAAGGSCVVRLDGRDLAASPSSVLAALHSALGGLEGSDEPTAAPDESDEPIAAPHGRLVLIIDAYERLGAVDAWVRTGLLPRLPADTLTLVAGRRPPGSGWRADAAWRDLLRVVSLRNLEPDQSRRYLRACEVDDALHDRLVEVTHGHPLALSLLADVVVRGGEAALDPLAPDLVGTIVRRFVDVVPDGPRRRALEVCALARATTEALLRDTLGPDVARDAFAWLRDLSFVESGPDGLLPHELARDVLDADLRWRDPDGYKDVFRGVRGHIYTALKSARGRDQQRAAFDLKFLFRNVPSVLSPLDWDAWGRHYPEPAGPHDGGRILELVAAAEGQASAAIAARWLALQPKAFVVVRGEDGDARGVLALLDLTAASEADRRADPGAQAAWNHAHRHAPVRPGEVITQTRFIVDREAYQGPSPTLNAAPVATLQRYLGTRKLAWDFLTLHEPEPWDDYFALADLPRATGADFVVGGRRYGLYGHDFRRVPVDALMELWTERALAQDPTWRPTAADDVLVLSQADFADAVRQALRDLHRPDLLERNPLLRTRLASDCAGTGRPDAGVLAALVRDAVDGLRQHPRDDKLLRAVDRTYLRPSPNQEAAAEVLGLPFSTYRRHVARGVERIVARLWDQEIYGVAPGGN
ncbi:MAG TPA: AAA family ATPase [Acidimicrobiales bacterium]